MLSFGSGGAQICVVGRTDFTSEAGALAGAMAEALARSFPVAFLPTDAAAQDRVTLPSGRVLPICRETGTILVSVHCDGPGSGIAPPGHLRYAWVAPRAEPMSATEAAWLDAHADAVLVPCAELVDAVRQSGVRRPVLHVPAPMDLDRPVLPPSQVAARLAALVDPSIAAFRGLAVDPSITRLTEARLGRRADMIGGVRRQVCASAGHGVLSDLNTYLGHLVRQQREDRCHAVLPDWDAGRLLGQPSDGNLWGKLFEPPFGATEAEMDDPRFLYRHATPPDGPPDEAPLAGGDALRRQYHSVFTRHVRLRPARRAEVAAFAALHLTAPILLAAHLPHPSPSGGDGCIERWLEQVRVAVRQRGGDPAGPGWSVFLVTDQASVLHRFRAAFGDRVVGFPEADRSIPGWETVRNAYAMARCHALLHTASDLSTAVAYMNPRIEMILGQATPRDVARSVSTTNGRPDRAADDGRRHMGLFSAIADKIFHHHSAAAAPTSAATGADPAASVSPASASPTVSSAPVDVGAVLIEMASKKGGGGNYETSIVDLLKLLDLDSSLNARKELGQELGVHAGDDGSAEQNIALHKAVMQKLAENGGKVPDSLKN